MRIITLLLIAFPCFTSAQLDSLTIRSNRIDVKLPMNENYQIVYEFIEKFDTAISDENLYQNFKYTLSVLTKQSSIGLTNSLFKINTSNDPLLFENKDSRHMIFQFMSRTLKNNDDPDDVVPDMVVLTKVDVRVKNHRVKITFKDIDCYFTSTGLAIVGGAENSMVNYDFNKLTAPTDDGSLKVIDGVYKVNNYVSKRIFTVDYKLKNKIVPYIVSEVKKNMKENDF